MGPCLAVGFNMAVQLRLGSSEGFLLRGGEPHGDCPVGYSRYSSNLAILMEHDDSPWTLGLSMFSQSHVG